MLRHRRATVACTALLAALVVGAGVTGCKDDSGATTKAVSSTSTSSAAPPTSDPVAAPSTTTVGPAGPGTAGVPGALTVTGPISGPTRIGPAPGSELDGIDRDAGVSVRLRDGSTLWLFGDTARADDRGALEYFVIGTAAWAAPGSPTVTSDYASGGEPIAFATPVAGFPPCPGSAPVAGMWPSSAVVQQVGPMDRVVVWMENICLGSSIRGAARGMAVAEWYYDPSRPPTDGPIQGRILNQTLFPQRSFGLASFVDDDGQAVVYACDAPEQGGTPEQYGPCRAAKVSLDQVANPLAYHVWDGASWNTDPIAARPLPLVGDGPGAYPAGSVSVAKDPGLGAYVMVYSPWPGYSDQLHVRVSPTPTGPWGPPTTVPLPGCSDEVNGTTFWCYAAAAQPLFSEPGKLGVGYYDRRVTSDPVRGSYLVATVPYSV